MAVRAIVARQDAWQAVADLHRTSSRWVSDTAPALHTLEPKGYGQTKTHTRKDTRIDTHIDTRKDTRIDIHTHRHTLTYTHRHTKTHA